MANFSVFWIFGSVNGETNFCYYHIQKEHKILRIYVQKNLKKIWVVLGSGPDLCVYPRVGRYSTRHLFVAETGQDAIFCTLHHLTFMYTHLHAVIILNKK